MTLVITPNPKKRGDRWLVGLIWEYCEPGQVTSKTTLHKSLQDFTGPTDSPFSPVGFVKYRHNMATLLGVATSNERARKQRPLMLLALMAEPAKRWIARYTLEDGKQWLVMVYDGLPMADGDQVLSPSDANHVWGRWIEENPGITQRDTATWAQTQQLISKWRQELGTVYVMRLPRVEPMPKLMSAKHRKVAILAGGLSVVALVAAVSLYASYQADQRRQAHDREILERSRQAVTNTDTAIATGFPWEDTPSLPKLIKQCLEQYAFQDTVDQGWQLSSWGCGSGRVALEWERLTYGTYHHMPAGASFNADSPDTASSEYMLERLDRRGPSPIATLDDASKYLGDLYLLYGVAVDLSDTERESSQAGFTAKEVVLRHIGQPPASVYQLISRVPGLVLERITFKQHTWEIKGVLYVAS